jgi:hypothetical protein
VSSSAGSRPPKLPPGKPLNTADGLNLPSREQMVRELQHQLGSLTESEVAALWKPAMGAWLRTLILGRSLESL